MQAEGLGCPEAKCMRPFQGAEFCLEFLRGSRIGSLLCTNARRWCLCGAFAATGIVPLQSRGLGDRFGEACRVTQVDST